MIGQNPVRPVYDPGSKMYKVTWILETVNVNPLFSARLGVVVLCDVGDLGRVSSDGKIHPTEGPHTWVWEFPVTDFDRPFFEVPYDVFVSYGMQEGATKTLNLRRSVGVDPTMLLPPEPPPTPEPERPDRP